METIKEITIKEINSAYGIMVIALLVEKLGFLGVVLLAMGHKVTNIIILVIIAIALLEFTL